MSYREMERRLAALEASADDTLNEHAGAAGVFWARFETVVEHAAHMEQDSVCMSEIEQIAVLARTDPGAAGLWLKRAARAALQRRGES